MRREQWRSIDGYEGIYEVSDRGRVRRILRGKGTYAGKILKPRKIGVNHKYLRCGLSRDGIQKELLVHRLVLAAFVGMCPDGMQANHLDGDKTNNALDNLEYVTPRENVIHAIKNGLRHQARGEDISSKLTEKDVRVIRELLQTETQVSIAKRFDVHYSTISSIYSRRNWGWLT